ncbi:acylphosphatase [Georgenia thermotolerans]|uniref:acylphosphatase n=1 Tax=Georgenia thermotolerans TaxID=527326 RepID=A0A7J5UKY3_9MICO|nr:acylphosphatase [Georgenia thermotolerans]KAE8763039.1 acylphosphatase [Georgenia thermotolerans]
MIRRRAIVHGLVQGVGFRYSCQAVAERLGLSGFAINRDDGTVEVVVEGDAAAVDRMLGWLNDGPRAAQVSRVDVTVEEPQGEAGFDTF